MLIENRDYFVRIVPFPPGRLDGWVSPNDDGTFSIYLDANADRPHQMAALDHELEHIELDHFYADKPIEVIEAEADGIIIPIQSASSPSDKSLDEKAEDWLNAWRKCMNDCFMEMMLHEGSRTEKASKR